MAVRDKDLEIRRPCPIKLDPERARGGKRSWHCGHCRKSVHVLSNMTEAEARRFLGERVGDDLCVTYAVRGDGSIRFRPEPPPPDLVPVSALRRSVHVAASLGLALAACTPHEHPDVPRGIEVVERSIDAHRVPPTVPDAEVHEEVLVDGMIEPLPMKPGGITVPELPPHAQNEPCEGPEEVPDPVVYRGQLRSPHRDEG